MLGQWTLDKRHWMYLNQLVLFQQSNDPLSPGNRERERHKTGGRTEGKGTPAWSESKPSGKRSPFLGLTTLKNGVFFMQSS